MKKIALIAVLLVLTACDNGYKVANYPVRPPELADCGIYVLNNIDGGSITVARCPNSATSTTYKSGKTTRTTIVVDGVEYEAKQ
jgi:hypothetical protein